MRIRVKFGENPYSNRFTCSHCGRAFESGGFFMRIECCEKIVDIPVCCACVEETAFFEGMVDLSDHHAAHPIERA